jgi:hypothetical protein
MVGPAVVCPFCGSVTIYCYYLGKTALIVILSLLIGPPRLCVSAVKKLEDEDEEDDNENDFSTL